MRGVSITSDARNAAALGTVTMHGTYYATSGALRIFHNARPLIALDLNPQSTVALFSR